MIVAITSDIDFVSDSVIEEAFKIFKGFPLTVFQTHESDYLYSSCEERWEMEIHPNFCNGSTQGNNYSEVNEYVSKIKHKKIGFRCHRYYSSNDIYERYAKEYKYVSNVCTDLKMVPPFDERCGLVQIPIFMEDGGYLKYHGTPNFDEVIKVMKGDGIYVFNFHPFHLAMNSNDFNYARKIKDKLGIEKYQNISMEEIKKFKNNQYGMIDFAKQLLDFCSSNNVEMVTLSELYERYKNNSI